MNFRGIEKTDKWGYIFTVFYNGEKFHSFDEMAGKVTVKGEFRKVMNELGFTWAKGIQQGGRTDAKVSAERNLLYVSSNFTGDLSEIIFKFNEKMKESIFIRKVQKTFPNLSFPEYVEKREYIYRYPKKRVKRSIEDIEKTLLEISGTYDVSKFTDKKGLELKEHERTVKVTYEKGVLKFIGNSFMPKQVRNMAGYILTGEVETFPGKFLTLENVYLKEELMNKMILSCDNLKISGVEKIEKTKDDEITILYVKKEKKGEVIGKNASNIKSLRKELGNIVIREI
ncbi:MAG: KH domain-containing protein [Cetobacterium sp.]|uniref:KH domain-containing protein n=1 Tax=Cetobacterium TaxID=180162 RepID=UPI001F0687A8|nr:KH domain-containing protein [Cetobacterium somerae]MCX3068297.1 KH domain-containing protein [Cetobacterium somerae]UPO97020.1 KH domain-containing protein [Cetobacterium somerae]